MKLDVIYQFNEKYAPYAGAAMTALFENNSHLKQIRVFILGEGLSADSISRFHQLENKYKRELVFVNTEVLIEKMKAMQLPPYRGSYAANMRLFLADLLDNSVDRLLYMDADTIVTAPLDDLITMDMGDAPLAMAMDSVVSKTREYVGISAKEDYFNSGVILFQMKKWREQRISVQIADYIQTNGAKLSAPDQDLLNLVCHGKIKLLDPRYNLQPMHIAFSTKDYYRCYLQAKYYERNVVEEARKHPVIVHFFRFMGEFPWHADNVHPDSELFDKYLSLSPWNDYQKQKADTNFFMKIEKLLYRFLPGPLFLRIFKYAHLFFAWRTEKAVAKGKRCKIYQG